MSKANYFIERSIFAALSFLKESIFAEEYAGKNGFLQSLDARIKTVTFFLFVILAILAKNILFILFLYVFCLSLAMASKISLTFFLKRTWVFMPLFSLLIAVPALFNFFTPGQELFTFYLSGFKISITRQGLFGASLFVMRVITSVSFAILLSITTRHFELLKVLRIFKIPQIFVMTAGICYRYIYLFVEVVENTFLSMKSRTGVKVHQSKGRNIVAWNIAYLWLRSYQMNEEVYQAMLSRGYTGEPAVLHDFKIRLRDKLWLICVIVLLLIAGHLNQQSKF